MAAGRDAEGSPASPSAWRTGSTWYPSSESEEEEREGGMAGPGRSGCSDDEVDVAGAGGRGREEAGARWCSGPLASERRVGGGGSEGDGKEEGKGWRRQEREEPTFLGLVVTALPTLCRLGKAAASLISSSHLPSPPAPPPQGVGPGLGASASASVSASRVEGLGMETTPALGGGGSLMGLGVGLVNLGLGLFRCEAVGV